MAQSLDPRVIKTYQALGESLLRLLEKKSLYEISVNEICAGASLRRATFYKHFENKYHLVRFVFREMIQSLGKQIWQDQGQTPDVFFSRACLALMNFAEEHIFLFRYREEDHFSSMAWAMMTANTAELYEQFLKETPREDPLPVPEEILSKLLAGSTTQGIAWWLEHRDKYSAQEAAGLLQPFFLSALQSGSPGADFRDR